MANATFRQVQQANNITTLADDDIIPGVQSPYGVGDDGGYLGSTIKEAIRDVVAAFATAGTGIAIVNDDPGDTLTFSSTITQYTDADAVGAVSDAVGGNGLVARTAADTFAARTLTGPAAGISVSNGDGVSGNPTLALANDLAALEGLASTGFAVRTGSDAWAQRSIASGVGVTVTNGDGVSGNPSIAINGYTYSSSQYFTSNGSFTKASFSGIRAVIVELVGGGGGGGGAGSTSAGQQSAGGGGGAGEYARKFILEGSLSASETVTVGAAGSASAGANGGNGGNSSFGSHVSANGGSGGSNGNGTSAVSLVGAGAGGDGGTGGDLNVKGSGGFRGFRNFNNSNSNSGAGGASYFGGSGASITTATTSAGAAGETGGGGSGGANFESQGSAVAGGAGGAGLVIVHVYK